MPSAYISQLIRQAATLKAKKPGSPTPADILPPSEAAIQAMARSIQGIEDEEVLAALERANQNGDVFFLPPGANLEVIPGTRQGEAWWPEVQVFRPLTRAELPRAPGPIESRTIEANRSRLDARWEIPRTELEISGEGYTRVPPERFMAREETGIAVANLAGVQRLELSSRDRPNILIGRRYGMSAAVWAAVGARLAEFNRDEPFSLSFWSRLGPAPTQPTPVAQAERVRVPEFEIASNPTIPLSEIRERRFNLVNRADPQFFEVSWVANPAPGHELRRVTPSPQRTEQSYTNAPRPYCPTFWERLLGEDPV